jgi:hypothetical protein
MVKDSTKYASTGGWGFAQFKDDKPANVALLNTCFSCHLPVKARDYVFTPLRALTVERKSISPCGGDLNRGGVWQHASRRYGGAQPASQPRASPSLRGARGESRARGESLCRVLPAEWLFNERGPQSREHFQNGRSVPAQVLGRAARVRAQ